MASEKDIRDIVNTLIAEGYAEGPESMRRIAETIINRGEQRGLSPADVVRQAKQYTGFENPGPAAVRAQSMPEARSAAQAAWELAQQPGDPTGGANHYFNPRLAQPSWAQSMTPLGNYGGHAYYTDRPVPPGEIPSVASLLDTRRSAPTPMLASGNVNTARTMTSPTGGNSALQQYVNERATARRNEVTPASADDRVNARNNAWVAANPVNDMLSPGAVNSMVTGLRQDSALAAAMAPRTPVSQSFAGQERAPVRVAPTPASVDSRINARNLSMTPAVPQSFAGQERSLVVPTQVIAQAPATRTVQSVPVRGNVPQGFAGQERGPAWGGAPASIPDRLMPSSALPPANFGGIPQSQVERIGVLSPATPAPAVRTAMATTPPMPRARPQQAPMAARNLIARALAPSLAPSPLSITVSGANRVAQALAPQSFSGTSTGNRYTPGQQYVMGGQVFTANPGGTFTNDRTGSELRGSSSSGRSLVETPDGMQWR